MFRKIKRANDIELFHRSLVIQQHKELDLRDAKIHLRGLQVRHVLDPLQFQAFQIDLGNSFGFVALAIHVQDMVVVSEIVLGQT